MARPLACPGRPREGARSFVSFTSRAAARGALAGRRSFKKKTNLASFFSFESAGNRANPSTPADQASSNYQTLCSVWHSPTAAALARATAHRESKKMTKNETKPTVSFKKTGFFKIGLYLFKKKTNATRPSRRAPPHALSKATRHHRNFFGP